MASPEIEFMMRVEQLRRQLDRDARRSVWQMIGALVLAFSLGVLVGRLWR